MNRKLHCLNVKNTMSQRLLPECSGFVDVCLLLKSHCYKCKVYSDNNDTVHIAKTVGMGVVGRFIRSITLCFKILKIPIEI